jgi:hypothetical protein
MEKFYLVRSPNCYQGNQSSIKGGNLNGRFETQEEAVRAATEFATQTQRSQLVYEVKLVGRASVAEAVWRPISEEV